MEDGFEKSKRICVKAFFWKIKACLRLNILEEADQDFTVLKALSSGNKEVEQLGEQIEFKKEELQFEEKRV